MGRLKPGASLIYERDGSTVYQREVGADPATRTEVGHDYDMHEEQRDHDQRERRRDLHQELMETKLWGNIRRAARTNPALKDLLDQVVMTYHLTQTGKLK